MDLTRDPLNDPAAASLRARVDQIADGPLALEEALDLWATMEREGLLPLDLQHRVFGLGGRQAPDVTEAAKAVARTRPAIAWETRTRPKTRVAVVVPGFLGSTLVSAGWLGSERTSWISAGGVIAGHVVDLRLAQDGRAPGAGARPCTPSGVMESVLGMVDFYGDLAAALSQEAHVYLHAYDWRKRPQDEALRLAAVVRDLHAVHDLPVGIVAHSLGGLLTSVALGEDDETRKIVDKVVIGGTPFLGSFMAPRVFLKTHEKLNEVSKADRYNDAHRWAEIFASFPGLHALVPSSAGWQDPLPRGVAACRSTDSYKATKVLPTQAHLDQGDDLLKRALQGLRVLAQGPGGDGLGLLVGVGLKTDAAFVERAGNWEVTTEGVDADGDETVLAESAKGPGSGAKVQTFEDVKHAFLFANEKVIKAAVEGLGLKAVARPKAAAAPAVVSSAEATSSIKAAVLMAEAAKHLQGPRAVRTSLSIARALSLLAREDNAGAMLAAETVGATLAAGPW